MDNTSRKFISLVSLSLFVLAVFIGIASAQADLVFGQKHFYSVIFRGNGEAVVYARMVITNPEEKPLTEFSFEIPKASPAEIVMYQIKLPKVCVRYDYSSPKRPCLEWRDPDYMKSYSYYGDSYMYSNNKIEYQKIQYTKSGNLYRFRLPTPVEPYKSTAIFIAYVAKGYVKERFGLFKFNFETIKVPSRIERIRVAVDVDSDLILKGKRAKVDYSYDVPASLSEEQPQSLSSVVLNRLVGSIGEYGALVKEAKSLAPNETFIVRGEYATNWFRLYLSEILITILIIAAIFTGIYFWTKFLQRRRRQSEQFGNGTNQQPPSQTPQSSVSIFNLINASVSLFSFVSVVVLSYLLRFLFRSDLFRYFIYELDFISTIFGFITIILLYVLAIFGPAIIVATKHGWKSFVAIVIAEFLWFAIFFTIYLSLFKSGSISNNFPPYVPY